MIKGLESQEKFQPHANALYFMYIIYIVGDVMLKPDSENSPDNLKTAIFAGGCFWCMEEPFAKCAGVTSVTAGYTGGTGTNPTYNDYAETGHIEAVKIIFDPSVILYDDLLDIFWRQIDPTDQDGQFVDRGTHYRTAIFYTDPEQKTRAENSKRSIDKSGRYAQPVVTQIREAGEFYPAEDYHLHYYAEHPDRYRFYREHSGRDEFITKIWKESSLKKNVPSQSLSFQKSSDDILKAKLSPLAYHVTQENGTEHAFANEYWDNKRDGLYVDIISGEVLFSSNDKFDSATGWPSFTRPVTPDALITKRGLGTDDYRTEIRSARSDAHLGHVFDDGPLPTHKRYCLNSAALKFIEKKDLKAEGYGEYLILFE